MTTGVILAGGEASRMPNKILLPVECGVLFESALKFLRRSECDPIVIVQNKLRWPELYLKSRHRDEGIQFVVQPEPEGVCDAINRAAPLVSDYACITFADNLYPWDHIHNYTGENYATYMNLKDHPKAVKAQLDRYPWEQRKLDDHDTFFAGYMHLSRRTMEDVSGNLMDAFNRFKIKGQKVNDIGWWDLGTVENYQSYLHLRSIT